MRNWMRANEFAIIVLLSLAVSLSAIYLGVKIEELIQIWQQPTGGTLWL